MNCRILFPVLFVSLVGFTMVLYNSGWFNIPLYKKPEMLSYWAAIGQWKLGLRHKPDLKCGDMNVGTKARKLHFTFKNKDLNSANILHSFQNRIIGKNVTMFGDSLQLELFKSMANILKTHGRRTATTLQNTHCCYKHRLHTCTSKMRRFNLRVAYFFEYESFLCKSVNTKYIISRKMIAEEIQNSDIIIFNLGIHYDKCNISTYKRALEEIASILKTELIKHPEKQIVFRNTLPQHFNIGNNTGGYFPGFKKSTACFGNNNVQHWTNKYLKEVSKQYGFKYLESFPIYADRWDLHPPKTDSLDCTHFCYTPELIVPEIALLNTLITA